MENEQEKKRPNEEKEDPTNKRQKKSQEWTKYEDMNNKLFEEFYKSQKIMNENEWEKFLESLRESLPITFRINTTDKERAKQILAKVEKYAEELKELEIDGKKIEPPKPISWIPNKMGWHYDVSKANLKKFEILHEFKKFIQAEHLSGGITRQEAVSMLPPLFMDVKSDHKVIDMCAAPGSKTSQLLEMLHAYENPTGFIVANDNDQKRAYLLIHTLARMSKLFPNVIVTNHDAQLYPSLNVGESMLQFDRILCDVMCSGDGTLRKSPDVWKKWKPTIGMSLHPQQVKVAVRAANMLKKGGRMVYSTCSLNPIENEASVAELLRRSKGSLELVDCSKLLDGFKYRPGMNTWVVMSKDGKILEKPGEDKKNVYAEKSMFPPTKEEADTFHLEYTMRVLPHDQNTGGFFVAVIQKVKEMSNDESKPRKERIVKNKGKDNQSDVYRDLNEEFKTYLFDFFGMKENIKTNRLYSKAETVEKEKMPKKIYYSSKSVSEVIEANQEQKKWKILTMGIRLFEYTNGEYDCPYRITQEGLEVLIDQISTDRIIELEKKEFLHFIDSSFIRPGEFQEQSIQKKVEGLKSGACIVVCKGTNVMISAMKQKTVLMKYAKLEDINTMKEILK